MKKITVIATGGTIAMREETATGRLVPAETGEELCAATHGLSGIAEISVTNFSNIPSEWMTPAKMLALSREIDRLARETDADGFVVTHGTDTMEETAFLLELTLGTEKPVVLTGAMRGASDVSADGPANLLSAARVAADGGARGRGVLVVMEDTVFSAWDVTKAHTTRTDAFRAPEWGPVGAVSGGRVRWGGRSARRVKISAEAVTADVWLVKCAAGTGKDIFLAARAAGAGAIVEGLGCGNVPRGAAEGIRALLSAGLPVVLTSRVGAGSVEKEYGHETSAAALEDAGCILGGRLSGQKARLLLLLALSAGKTREEIRELFTQAGE